MLSVVSRPRRIKPQNKDIMVSKGLLPAEEENAIPCLKAAWGAGGVQPRREAEGDCMRQCRDEIRREEMSFAKMEFLY